MESSYCVCGRDAERSKVIVIINIFGVKGYGEVEFVLSIIKIIAVVAFNILGIVLVAGESTTPGGYVGGRYWRDPGPFANGINGFGQTFLLAAVYYCGTEMLAMTAAESRNPTRDLPRAIRNTFWRIVIIFMGLVFFAGLLIPSDSPDLLTAKSRTGKSPWTIAFIQAGVPEMGHVVNVVLFVPSAPLIFRLPMTDHDVRNLGSPPSSPQ